MKNSITRFSFVFLLIFSSCHDPIEINPKKQEAIKLSTDLPKSALTGPISEILWGVKNFFSPPQKNNDSNQKESQSLNPDNEIEKNTEEKPTQNLNDSDSQITSLNQNEKNLQEVPTRNLSSDEYKEVKTELNELLIRIQELVQNLKLKFLVKPSEKQAIEDLFEDWDKLNTSLELGNIDSFKFGLIDLNSKIKNWEEKLNWTYSGLRAASYFFETIKSLF